MPGPTVTITINSISAPNPPNATATFVPVPSIPGGGSVSEDGTIDISTRTANAAEVSLKFALSADLQGLGYVFVSPYVRFAVPNDVAPPFGAPAPGTESGGPFSVSVDDSDLPEQWEYTLYLNLGGRTPITIDPRVINR